MIINTHPQFKELRKLSEKLLQRGPESNQEKSPDDRDKIVHELRVHQIELEMQNEELRKTHSELEESRDRYHDFYDFAPLGYLTIDENGLIQEVTLTGSELLGVERRYLMKVGFSQFIVPENQDAFYFLRQKLIETRDKQTFELKLLKKDGTQFFARLQCITIGDDKRNFKGLRVAIPDISKLKHTEEELEKYRIHLEELVKERTAQLAATNEQLKQEVTNRMRTESKYRNLMENAGDAILLYDEKSNLVEVNKKAEILLGYNRQELMNMNITRIHPKEDLERTLRVFKEVRRKGEGELINGFVLRKDGKMVPVDITESVVKFGDKEVVQGIYRDITIRKKIEAEFLKIEKLEAVGVLAGGIAHDFNNMLIGILGNLSLAELYIKPETRAFDLLTKAKQATRRTGELTKQLLTFSKGGAPVKNTASISELIKQTASFSLRGANVKYEYSVPDNLWPAIIDEGQISQVINNLMINANQAMPQGGAISISAENVIIEVNDLLPLKEGKYIRVSVKDQGPGIPQEHLIKIFDPYFTTKESGSGLGLASCYSIAKNHGGYITVESETGVGTTFHIYLPASEKEVFKVEGITEEIKYSGTGKILLMDDEQGVRDTVSEMLIELGYEVEIAKNGIEAIELYKKANEAGPFDAVILDLTIPGNMGGKETLQKLLLRNPDIKAIVSSGYSNDPLMAEYENYGFKGVVAKPYEIRELSKVLHNLINGKEVSSVKKPAPLSTK